MKRLWGMILSFAVLFVIGCSPLAPANNSSGLSTPAADKQVPMKQATPSGDQAASTANRLVKVRIFLIALGDNGASGKMLETGDSLVPVTREVNASAPLRGAIEDLLSLKDRYYGESGLFNPLCDAKLKVDSVSLQDGRATIKLTGQMNLGGEMDIPRVKGQLLETAMQFSTVKSVAIFVNGQTLDEALSLK